MNKEVEKICNEIERIKKRIMDGWQSPEGHISSSSRGALEALNEVLSFLNTLEVKEVDVEKKSELIANSIMIPVQANLYHTNVYDYEKRCYKHSDLKDAARKGIELGLNAQKGE